MILRPTFVTATAGLSLLAPFISVGAQQIQRTNVSLDRKNQQVDGNDVSNTNRILLHRRKKMQQKKHTRKLQSSQCKSIIAINSISEAMSDHGEEDNEDFLCEVDHGVTLPIAGTDAQISKMRAMLHDGTLISNESSIEVLQEVPLMEAMIKEDDDSESAFSSLLQGSVTLPPGDVNIINSPDRRRLNYKVQYGGKSQALVVKITDKDGLAVEGDAGYISDKIFGTDGDEINPAQGFKDCSFGKFELTNEYSVDIEDKLAAPGVIEVDINISLTSSSQSEIRAHAQKAVEEKLGLALPGVSGNNMYLCLYTWCLGCRFKTH